MTDSIHESETAAGLARQLDACAERVLTAYASQPASETHQVTPPLLAEAIGQYGHILKGLEERDPEQRGSEDMTELADYGQGLISDLALWARHLEQEETAATLEKLHIPLAVWIGRHGGRIQTLEPIVNAFANHANETADTTQLKQLAAQIGEVIEAVAEPIKQDLEQADPSRPWRIVHLNRAIVATRAQDSAEMQAAYSALLSRFPDDAAGFFDEGLKRADQQGFPEPIRKMLAAYKEQADQSRHH